MACNNYLPRFQKQLNTWDPLGSLNCTSYSGAMAAQYHTCGAKYTTGKTVRDWTGDKSGGTSLRQIDYALNSRMGIDLDTRVGSARLTWPQFAAKINAGRGAILQGGYAPIRYSRFAGSKTFLGNHAIFIPPGWKAMDPLADGRYAGIYKYRGEPYPQALLKDFAGRLVLDPSTGRRLGYGYVWASFTRDNESVIVTPPGTYQHKVVVPKGTFIRYVTYNGVIQKYSKHYTGGFSAYCTAPKTYKAKKGLPFISRTLVRIETGAYKGWMIGSRYEKEI